MALTVRPARPARPACEGGQLVTRPQIIFLDEPVTGLDPRSRRTMWNIVRELVGEDAVVRANLEGSEHPDVHLADFAAGDRRASSR